MVNWEAGKAVGMKAKRLGNLSQPILHAMSVLEVPLPSVYFSIGLTYCILDQDIFDELAGTDPMSEIGPYSH